MDYLLKITMYLQHMLFKFSVLTFLALRLNVVVSIDAVTSSIVNSDRGGGGCIGGICWDCYNKDIQLGDELAIRLKVNYIQSIKL